MATAKIKRIFITGSAGSLWSTVDRYLRWGLGLRQDDSDVTRERSWHGHTGAYHNPGNEPGFNWILNFGDYDRAEIERMMDSAYSYPVPEDREYIIRVHKSHMFAYHLEHIEKLFPEADIIASVQDPYKSMLWWGLSGGVETVFDNYDFYERDVEAIWKEINDQNEACEKWIDKNNLPREYLNNKWFKKYYGEPSHLLKRYEEDFHRNPDGIDNMYGRNSMHKNISNTAFAAVKQGTMKVNY
jgi:hypothetical protein